jgi:hypothetical protein
MHERVAAQGRVASGQGIAGDIGEMVFAFDFTGGSAGRLGGINDQRG